MRNFMKPRARPCKLVGFLVHSAPRVIVTLRSARPQPRYSLHPVASPGATEGPHGLAGAVGWLSGCSWLTTSG